MACAKKRKCRGGTQLAVNPDGNGRLCPFGTFGVDDLGDLLLLAYAGAVGFVAAGITASLYKVITSEPARFGLLGESALALITTFAFCALSGPVIVVSRAIETRRTYQLPLGWVAAGIAVAGLWSCCLGIVVLRIALSI